MAWLRRTRLRHALPRRLLHASALLAAAGAPVAASPVAARPAASAPGPLRVPGPTLAPAPAPRQSAPAPSIQLPAPAPESTLRQDDLRVARIAYRLALAGRDLCPRPWPLTGLLFHHLAEYEPHDRPRILARYPLDRGPGILSVVGGSPAAVAGLAAGDVLIAVNGVPFRSPAATLAQPDRKKWRPMVEAAELQLEQALEKGPAELIVLRGSGELRLRLSSLPACLGRVRLARSTQVNAFATGRYVVMTTAMLRFLRNDDELAVVLGHEMAHDIYGDPATRSEEGLLSGLGIKPSALWQREARADRFGIRLMAAAGFDLDAVLPFWRRYLGKYDWFPQLFRSHPSLGARERIAGDEIAAIRRGEPFRP